MSTAQEEFDALVRDTDRPSRHPEDDSISASDSEESVTLHSSISEVTKSENIRGNCYIPRLPSEANTGPKGVIADAQAYEQAKRRAKNPSQPQKPRILSYNSWKSYPKAENGVLSGDKEDEEEEPEQDDDEFMQEWRQSRLKQLQILGWDPSASKLGGARRTYGTLEAVDAHRYLDAVEKTPLGTVVVVFISDDDTEISDMVEACLITIARQYETTRFVKLHYKEAEIEVAGVPAILAYRNGDKFAGLVPVIEEIPDDADLNSSTLEAVLMKHQILFQ